MIHFILHLDDLEKIQYLHKILNGFHILCIKDYGWYSRKVTNLEQWLTLEF